LIPNYVILRNLSGREFEELCKTVFERLGYRNVELGPGTGDLGADIIMESPSHERVVVQCKRYLGRTVDRRFVDELYAVVKRHNADVGMLVTTGRFTENAKKCALDLYDVKLELIDLKDFKYLAERAGFIVYDEPGLERLPWGLYRIAETRIDDYVDTARPQPKIQTSTTPSWLRIASQMVGTAVGMLIGIAVGLGTAVSKAAASHAAVMGSRRKHRRKTKPNSWWSWW
jgi:hypothetical protein